MFNSVEYVRDICSKRNIPVSQLEKDCGFANGYMNPKKLKKIPYDRAKMIADYLGLSLEYLLTGADEKKKHQPLLKRADTTLILIFIELNEQKKECLKLNGKNK